MSQSLCNRHWSRQVSNMRHWWNKIFFVIIRVMVVVNQMIVMAPFIYYKNTTKTNKSPAMSATSNKDFPQVLHVKWKYRTHRLVTGMAIFLCLLYTIASPFMVKMATDLYNTTRRNTDNLFTTIAKFTLACDVLCALLIMLTNIIYRKRIVNILNLFNETLFRFEQLNRNLVDLRIFLFFILKLSLTMYEILLSLPFLASAASRMSSSSVVAFLFTQYLQGICSIFTFNVFTFILIMLVMSLQLEKELNVMETPSDPMKMSHLISLQNVVQQLISLFVSTFQFNIFLMVFVYFITILCNIYAMLDYYVTTNYLFITFIAYIVSVALELYSLIIVAYFCHRSQRRVKDLFLLREELHFMQVFHIWKVSYYLEIRSKGDLKFYFRFFIFRCTGFITSNISGYGCLMAPIAAVWNLGSL